MSSILEDYFQEWYDSHGGILDLDQIHDEVADPGHRLHDRYEWDDAKCGREYRKQQIARDIRTCRIVYVSQSGNHEAARRFLANRDIERGLSGYTAANDALKDPEVIAALERTLNLEMKNLRRRYEHLVAYADYMQREADRARAGRAHPVKTAKKVLPIRRSSAVPR